MRVVEACHCFCICATFWLEICSPAGDYEVSIRFNDEHIPDSPFIVPVASPSDDARRLTVASLQVRLWDTHTSVCTHTSPQYTAYNAAAADRSFTFVLYQIGVWVWTEYHQHLQCKKLIISYAFLNALTFSFGGFTQ